MITGIEMPTGPANPTFALVILSTSASSAKVTSWLAPNNLVSFTSLISLSPGTKQA